MAAPEVSACPAPVRGHPATDRAQTADRHSSLGGAPSRRSSADISVFLGAAVTS